MGTFLNILLDILAILVIIGVGSLLVVVVAELILHLFDNGRRRDKDKDEVARVVQDNDIVVYSGSNNPNEVNLVNAQKVSSIDGDKIEEIDYDKAMEEQRMLQSKKGSVPAPVSTPKQSKTIEQAPNNNDMFLDSDDDEEFQKLLDEVIKEAKNSGKAKNLVKVEDSLGVVDEDNNKSKKQEPLVVGLDEASKKELEEIKAIAKQQQKELDEFKKMQEAGKGVESKPELDDETKKELEELRALKDKQQQELEELKEYQKAQKQKELDEMNARKEQQRQQELEELRELQRQQQKEFEEYKKAQEEKVKAKSDDKPSKKELDEETKKELEELRALKEKQQKELEELKAEQKAQQQKELEEMNARKEQQRQQEIDELKALKEQQQKEIEELKAQQKAQQKEFEDFINRKENPQANVQSIVEDKNDKLNEQTQRELEELRSLKQQQREEIEEFRQMKEDFAKEKEEQISLLKENLEKAKEEEIERIRQELLKEQERLENLQEQLEEERKQWEEERARIIEAEETKTPLTIMYDVDGDGEEDEVKEPIVQETIIRDEEELNRLKYKNLMRMNNRLTRIIRDTERLQIQKQKEIVKNEEEKRRILARQEQERIREQEKFNELAQKEQERLRREQEAIEKKNTIAQKLEEASKKAGKYKLDSKVVKITRERKFVGGDTEEIEEKVVDSAVAVTTVEKEPLKSTAKPVFDKAYYDNKLVELEDELRDTEKELRNVKAEYIPLTRIYKAYERDGEKLRKKEMQVAKQKVALYGVNSKNVDPAKKEKLDENLQALAELKDSVLHCEEIIKKNKDRYPVIEKNYNLIMRHIQRINEDMKVCQKALSYYNKKLK